MILLCLMLAAQLSTDQLQTRYLVGKRAAQDLIRFAQLTEPLPSDPLNTSVSRYLASRHHLLVADALMKVERGEINRLEIEMPYRHGKTELTVRKFIPWATGRKPDRGIITITYADSLAWEHGRDCRNVFLSAGYRLAFGRKPEAQLRDDSRSMDRLQTVGGGVAMFTGRGGMGGGFGAGILNFDDFFKNAEEAMSQATRDHAWQCYVSDCRSRLNESTGAIIITGTRKHADDVQGRLFDPLNPHYDAREAARWTRIRLPALAEDDDQLGRKKDEALWPERFPFEFWNEQRTHKSPIVRIDFQTQGQCNPTPEEGNYFKKDWLKEYQPNELPKELRVYVSSDHAYKSSQKNDLQCQMPFGVDATDSIWILPDTWWERAETDVMVDNMLKLMRERKPFAWWAAKDAISGSVGPFLKKRMREEKLYCSIEEVTEDKDLVRRAQSIRNRAAMGMVHFPAGAPWWQRMKKELLDFPNGTHDDAVAALAIIGIGLDRLVPAETEYRPVDYLAKPMTMAWVKQSNKIERAREKAAANLTGW